MPSKITPGEQQEIYELRRQNLSMKEIEARVGSSYSTVRRYCERFDKEQEIRLSPAARMDQGMYDKLAWLVTWIVDVTCPGPGCGWEFFGWANWTEWHCPSCGHRWHWDPEKKADGSGGKG